MVAAWILTISEHVGPIQYGRESANKSRAVRAHPSLGDLFEIQHINEEENVLISGTREQSALEILPSLNSKDFFSGPPTFPATPAFRLLVYPTIVTYTKKRLCTTTLVLLHTGICVWGT